MKKFLSVFCLILIGSTALAQQTPPSPPVFTESFIYMATKEACTNLPAHLINSSNIIHDKLRAGYFPSDSFTKIMTQIRHETFMFSMSLDYAATSPTTKLMRGSPNFKRALRECYGENDQYSILFFERSIDRSSSAGRWFGSAANLVQFYGGARIFSAGFKYLKSLSYLQGVFSEKYAVLRKWAYRGVLAGVGGLVGLQVYQARKSVYDATLLLINEQEKALEKFPRVKEWVRGELRAEGLVSDANEMIDTLTKEADLVEDIVIQSTQDQIVALYAKRAELSDPEAIAVIDKGIAIFKARLEERQALKKTRKAS